MGVVTENGEAFRTPVVVSNPNPKLLYRKLMDAAVLPKEFVERIVQWPCGSGTHPGAGVTGAPGHNGR